MNLQRLSPILWTKNLTETVDFYENVLGFKAQSNFPNFVYLFREEVALMFIIPEQEPEECREESEEVFFPKAKLTGSIYIYCRDADAIWNQVKDKASIASEIADREYLMRDFSIRDNNGYEIVFGTDISELKK
jgi:catechol 2,3-dioxygenase-like lactoylglutathione lyase family enzyme